MELEDYLKWLFVVMGVYFVLSGIHDIYKTHVISQIEIAKIQNQKCNNVTPP